MKKVISHLLKTAALLTCAFSACSVLADEKITIMVGGMEKQIYLPAKLTEQLGYFKEQGLDVDIQSEPSGVNAENEMLAGAVQGVVGFYDHTIDLQAKGKAAMSVVQFSQAPGEVVLIPSKLANEIKSPANFKGRTLGVTGLGSSTNFLMQYLSVSAGLTLADITPLPVGAGTTFIAAMKQGRIDAGMTTEPTVSTMVNSGDAKILIDLRTPELTTKALGGLYPAACFYMPTAWVNAHPVEVQKLANAFVKTLKFINTHSAEEITSYMPADYYASNKDQYIKSLADSKKMFTPDGVMPQTGPTTVLKILQSFDKAVIGKNIDLSQTFTTKFVSNAK
jgi:NitT/TauT family transport system substrate-binding protein